MRQTEVVFITPPVSKSDVVIDLVNLTEFLIKNNKADQVRGFLGGEFGYGCIFKNEVFEMFPYYWGTCTCGHEERESKLLNNFTKLHKHLPSCFHMKWERWKKSWEKRYGDPYRSKEASKQFDKDSLRFCKQTKQSGIYNTVAAETACTCGFDVKLQAFEDSLGTCHKACLTQKPNFIHFETGLEIKWYKYIGRGMEYNQQVTKKLWLPVYNGCLESVN